MFIWILIIQNSFCTRRLNAPCLPSYQNIILLPNVHRDKKLKKFAVKMVVGVTFKGYLWYICSFKVQHSTNVMHSNKHSGNISCIFLRVYFFHLIHFWIITCESYKFLAFIFNSDLWGKAMREVYFHYCLTQYKSQWKLDKPMAWENTFQFQILF